MHPGTTLTDAIRMWPTPTEDNANNAGGPSRQAGMGNGGYQDLTVAANFWATPQAHDQHGAKTEEQLEAHRQKTGSGARNLNEDVSHWQTPATDSFRSRGGERKEEMGLDQQARMFPTPAARDYRTPNKRTRTDRGGGLKGEQLPNFVEHHLPSRPVPQMEDGQPSSPDGRGSRRRLNPVFCEWLMNLPPFWTLP